jgi:ABC-type transport system involved in multi-copper enzyme maturation permease subunit
MSLIKTELNRFVSRRFILLMVVVLFAAFAVTVATVLASSERPDDQMWAQARQNAAQQRAYLTTEYQNCRAALTDRRQCEGYNPDSVRDEDFLYGVFRFSREIKPLLYFLGAFLALFGFLVSATFVGAELTSGGMTNLLLWRPQRLTVLGAKLGVALGGVAVVSAVYTVLYVATFYGIAQTSGLTGDPSPAFWQEIIQLCLRCIGFALIASGLAFAIATIGRHTAAALGALIAYVIVWEGGARLVTEIVSSGSSGADPFFLSSHVAAWFSGAYEYYVMSYDYTGGMRTIYLWHSAAVLLAIVGGLLALAFAQFHRRDLA